MSNKTTIKCPNCGTEIDINQALYHQLENKHKQEWLDEKKKQEAEIEAKRKEYKVHLDTLKAKEESFVQQQEKFDDSVHKATQEQLRIEKSKLQAILTEQIKQTIMSEQSTAMDAMRKELEAKSEQVKELNNSKVEIERLKREKDELSSKIQIEAQLAFTKELMSEKEKITKQLQDENELKFKEKEKQLDDQKKLIEEMKRKADQGPSIFPWRAGLRRS